MSLQENLRQLFVLDSQLRGMRSRLDSAISRTQKQKARLEQLQRQRSELGEQIKLVQVKASTSEKQSQDIETRIETHRTAMNSVKNNKEYSALLIEVNTLKIEKGKIEDEALVHLTRVDQLKQEAAELDAKIEEQSKLVGMTENEVNTCRAELGQQLEELTVKRNAAEQEVPLEARTVFNKLSNALEGEAMAHVIEENRRNMEYSCGGCYIGLPIERVNALMRRPDEVICCPSCGRILYLDAEIKASLVK